MRLGSGLRLRLGHRSQDSPSGVYVCADSLHTMRVCGLQQRRRCAGARWDLPAGTPGLPRRAVGVSGAPGEAGHVIACSLRDGAQWPAAVPRHASSQCLDGPLRAGSGKSTSLRLLFRFYDPSAGAQPRPDPRCDVSVC